MPAEANLLFNFMDHQNTGYVDKNDFVNFLIAEIDETRLKTMQQLILDKIVGVFLFFVFFFCFFIFTAMYISFLFVFV